VGEGHTILIGIDISKDTFDVTLLTTVDSAPAWTDKLNNDLAGVQDLLRRSDPAIAWVVEPTGRYSNLVVQQGTQAGRRVLMAPPRAAKLFLKSQNTRVKSDKIDSLGLAAFGLSRCLRPFVPKDPVVDHLDQLLTARKGLVRSVQALKMQRTELPRAADALEPAIIALQKQIKDLDKRIGAIVQDTPKLELVKRLQTIPGVGPVLAAAAGSRLIAKDFASPDALTAYIGLDVGVRQSGKSIGRTKLSKQGDPELRRLFFLAALASLRCKQSVFKDQYAVQRNRGRSHVEAVNIVARKIAHVCLALRKSGGTFDASKVGHRQSTETEPGQASNDLT